MPRSEPSLVTKQEPIAISPHESISAHLQRRLASATDSQNVLRSIAGCGIIVLDDRDSDGQRYPIFQRDLVEAEDPAHALRFMPACVPKVRRFTSQVSNHEPFGAVTHKGFTQYEVLKRYQMLDRPWLLPAPGCVEVTRIEERRLLSRE